MRKGHLCPFNQIFDQKLTLDLLNLSRFLNLYRFSRTFTKCPYFVLVLRQVLYPR